MSCLTYYLLAINVVAFIMYGIDKIQGQESQVAHSVKPRFLLLAVLGEASGHGWGMKVWHHKTMHKKFKYGIPAILLIQIAAMMAYLHMNR